MMMKMFRKAYQKTPNKQMEKTLFADTQYALRKWSNEVPAAKN